MENTIASWFVCVMGMGTVFIGLIFLILLCLAMGAIFKAVGKKSPDASKTAPAPAATPAAVSANAPIQNKQEIVAGVCAVIAEELGTDVSNIRVVSFKRV